MSEMLTAITAVFATWRLTSLLVQEAGPFDIFKKLREAVGLEHDDSGNVIDSSGGLLATLLICSFCTSLWVAVGVFALILVFPGTAVYILAPFALSAGAIVIDRWT